jgi:transcriptional regulator with XRE-family HTH domain
VDTHQTAPFLRRRLGRRLKAMREAAGLNLDLAAVKLDKTRSSLHRLETGVTRPDVHVVRTMMDVYDQYQDDLVDEVREALKPPWFRTYGIDKAGYVDVETYASRVCEFSGLNLPGLLQTEGYVKALLAGSRQRRTSQQINGIVEVRLIRQRRLGGEEGSLELMAVVDEAALRREVGGPEVMLYQLRHLVDAVANPAVTLQVLPLHGGAHSAMDGGFILLEFH